MPSELYLTHQVIPIERSLSKKRKEKLNIHAGMLLDYNPSTNILRIRNRGNTNLIHIFSRAGEDVPMNNNFKEKIKKLLKEGKISKFE